MPGMTVMRQHVIEGSSCRFKSFGGFALQIHINLDPTSPLLRTLPTGLGRGNQISMEAETSSVLDTQLIVDPSLGVTGRQGRQGHSCHSHRADGWGEKSSSSCTPHLSTV